ncbi:MULTISPECIES: DUF4189 domain-containing protein [Gordonia]|jgi:hypothetical protein|nr:MULTISPECIES: DUF4189 domain-containing protein [Gordonia]MBD0022016.1 DUF4189 domain-containing protein [Gordonia sp. (in: high G+C Gram-positive bacteria)]
MSAVRNGRAARFGAGLAAAALVTGGLLWAPAQADAANGPYGAIAYSGQTKRYGVATGKSTAKKASKSAKSKCANLGATDCKVIARMNDDCAAVAVNPFSGVTTSANAGNILAAQRAAREGTANGQIVASGCATSKDPF